MFVEICEQTDRQMKQNKSIYDYVCRVSFRKLGEEGGGERFVGSTIIFATSLIMHDRCGVI